MSHHFEFLATEWPDLADAVTNAEASVYADPRASASTRGEPRSGPCWLH
jgi:hypothetical protein